MFEFTLEKGSKKFVCPSCEQKTFVRYVSNQTGKHLSFDVGRCDRESKCGYHFTPKQFFIDNPQPEKLKNKSVFKRSGKGKNKGMSNYVLIDKNGSQANYEARNLPNKSDIIKSQYLLETLTNYEQNAFVQFLLNLFPDCAEEIQDVLKMYFVGTYEDYTCFPQIDRLNRICKAKLIRFNRMTGKRLKGEFDTSSLVAKLKKQGKVKADFQYKQIFFGEHLLSKFPNKPIAIVEAEKTAIVASLCFPEFVWLGSNSKTWLKAERLKRLGNRQIILYADADSFEQWQKIAQERRRNGQSVKVSSLIEEQATDAEKDNGFDLADYLINQQKQINQTNQFVDFFNAKLEKVLNDEKLYSDFETILEEQKAVLTIDGNLSETEAEIQITKPNNFRNIILSL